MLVTAALGCGILLGFAVAGLVGPLYWRLLAVCPLPRGPILRFVLRLQTALLAGAGHHPYAIACLHALADARDAAALAAARARLRWYCAIRVGSGV